MPDPQEPRTGGVAVHRVPIPVVEVEGFPGLWNYSPLLDPERPAVEPGRWFPLAEAEALIDPNDPETRATIRERAADRVDAAIFDWMGVTPSDEMVSETIDAVLAALRSKP